MDYQLALVILPVSDIDRAKSFYTERMGFSLEYDMAPTEQFRIVQLRPPGSPCAVAVGQGLTATVQAPGSAQGLRLVVGDIEQARQELAGRGCEVSSIDDRPWGRFAWLSDPDGNGWELCQLPSGS